MISICMNDSQPVISHIQEHLYVRKSEYVLVIFFYYYCFFIHHSNYSYCIFQVLK